MRQGQLVEQRGKKDASNSAVEILEWMNPLEAPVGPGQKFCTIRNRLLIEMQQPRAQVVAKLAHVDRHFVVRRWGVSTDLDIHIAEAPGPIREQMTSETLVADTQPFRGDNESDRGGSEEFRRR